MTTNTNTNNHDLSSTDTALSESTTLAQRWSPLRRRNGLHEAYSIPLEETASHPSERSRSWSLPHRKDIRNLDDISRALHGYPRLAKYMAHEPGMAIARRFTASNQRILLYRQAQIVCLEHDLDEMEQNFAVQKHLHQNIRELMYAEPGSDGEKLWQKIQELDTALEKYSKLKRDCWYDHLAENKSTDRLLLGQKALYDLPAADHIAVNDLNNFANCEALGGSWMEHPEDTVFEIFYEDGKYKAEQKDLVRLSGAARYSDPFTRWFWGTFLQFFHDVYRRFRVPASFLAKKRDKLTISQQADRPDGSYTYESTALYLIARTTSMAMASLLPTISILALYHINSDLWRIGFIAMFSVVFTACLSIFTAATRIEIFIASLGLASVQVVFIGNLLTPSIAPTTSRKSQ